MTKNELIEKYTSVPPLKESLAKKERPVVLYGTGNGADKVISMLLEPIGVRPDAVFASDGFVRNREFAGLPVESFSDVARRYGKDMKILMCFGSDREEVLECVERLDRGFDLAIPDVPLYGQGLFDTDYMREHIDELAEVRAMFADDYSKELFDESVLYRLTGKLKYLQRTEPLADTYRALLGNAGIKIAVDGGAYRGETSRMFAQTLPSLKVIYAVEPDERTLAKFEAPKSCEMEMVISALADFCGEVTFHGSASRGAGIEGTNRRGKDRTVRCLTLDHIVWEEPGLIKLDVEGFEECALRGAKRLMTEFAPSLAVSLYHRTEDVFELPLMIKNFSPEYAAMKYYLRRPKCVPCWDLTLFAVKE